MLLPLPNHILLIIEGVHRLFRELLEFEVWHEQVATFRELPKYILAIRFMQICIVLQTCNLQELEAPLNILFF